MNAEIITNNWVKGWKGFKKNLPHQNDEYASRNWGHNNHSICSYQGKLKPAIAYHLVKTFVPTGGKVLDPFSGVGTIPFEAALSGRESFGFDISLPAYYISRAKVSQIDSNKILKEMGKLKTYIETEVCSRTDINEAKNFGFNKKIADYFEKQTLKEILLARNYFIKHPPKSPEQFLIISCILHILHGNRPYALSRRSHPIVPYAPTGEFLYKSLIDKLSQKINKVLTTELPGEFKPGKIFHHDIMETWPEDVNNLDSIITSPPFFDSTRFYLANWMRIWFCGWTENDFKLQPKHFIDERQKSSLNVYETIFTNAKERLNNQGVLVLHLGKSKKCDMGIELQRLSHRFFSHSELFDESVAHCESHGIRDKGSVTSHQYLLLY